VATAAVGVLGFLGAGVEDLSSAFQITFVASVLFGLVAFDLLERPAPPPPGRRRDVLASVALLASLMCSTVGDAMVVGAAVLLFARRPRETLPACWPYRWRATWCGSPSSAGPASARRGTLSP